MSSKRYNEAKKIIESSEKKLSDEKIRTILKEEYNIEIARRTVQKYRTQLNISSSSFKQTTSTTTTFRNNISINI